MLIMTEVRSNSSEMTTRHLLHDTGIITCTLLAITSTDFSSSTATPLMDCRPKESGFQRLLAASEPLLYKLQQLLVDRIVLGNGAQQVKRRIWQVS